MVVATLFGTEQVSRKIRLKVIRPVFSTLTIKEEISQYFDSEIRYTDPAQVFQIFQFLRQETKEHFISLHLDGKNRIVCMDRISVGSLNQSIVHPREVFKTALLSSAAAIILLHNHPTGDPTPSREDMAITRRLSEGGEILGIKILDHIIIGETFTSFVSQGLM